LYPRRASLVPSGWSPEGRWSNNQISLGALHLDIKSEHNIHDELRITSKGSHSMSRLITNEDRLKRASVLIQQARQLPVGSDNTFLELGYVAQVKDLLRQARDLVKFIPFSPSADDDMKRATKELLRRLEETEKELLHRR